jgi:hypothetical protein
MLKEDFRNIFVRSNSPEELLQGFKSLNVHIWVNGLTTQHNIYQNQLFCIQKNVGHDFPAKFLLPRRSCIMPFQLLSFCLQSQLMDSSFILRDDLWQKASAVSLVTEEESWTHHFPHSSEVVWKASWKPTTTQSYTAAASRTFKINHR